MDSVLHTFVGAALADRLTHHCQPASARVAAVGTAIVAANAPDIDLAYTWITEPPLGFLLHHRGHSHTFLGGLVLGALIFASVRFSPLRRQAESVGFGRLGVLIGLSLSSHLLIDVQNVFGLPLWYPLSSRWFFGDASFIFEPWLWLILGIPLLLNAVSTSAKVVIAALVSVPTTAAVYFGVLPTRALLILVVFGVLYWGWLKRQESTTPIAIALGGTVVMFAILGALSHVVQRQILDARHSTLPTTTVLDVVLEPDPGVPWCWSALTVERHRTSAEDVSNVNRATVSLIPRAWPPTWCASYVLFRRGKFTNADGSMIAWTAQWQTNTDVLQSLSKDCWAGAWFQFGRVPQVVAGTLRDLRLENPIHENFTALSLARERVDCPSNLTSWRPPRADLLEGVRRRRPRARRAPGGDCQCSFAMVHVQMWLVDPHEPGRCDRFDRSFYRPADHARRLNPDGRRRRGL